MPRQLAGNNTHKVKKKRNFATPEEGVASLLPQPSKQAVLIFIMNWLILIAAGLCEVAFTFCLGRAKETDGIEWWAWIGGFICFSILSMALLAKATQTLPIGTAYPVWTGIGAVGTVIVGILVFGEPATFWRLFFITLLISSIVGLKTME